MRLLRLFILVSLLLGTPAALCVESEARLKTAFLYQFTKYIDWPVSDLPENFNIFLVGKSDVLTYLNELAKEKKIKDRPISIRQVQTPEEVTGAQIVFLAGDNVNFLDSLLGKVQGRPTLVVTEGTGFAQRGATLNFFITVDGKLRFEANRKAAEKNKLILSSQLLKMATLVEE